MKKELFNFDISLSLIYEETGDSDINPVIYISKYFELLKNQIDLYENNEILNGKNSTEKYTEIFAKIENYEKVCVENFRNNSENFQKKLKKITNDVLMLENEPKTEYSVEKALNIRKESINLRREIFKHNIIFLDKKDEKQVGSLIIIDPFCIDDFQIDVIK